MKCQSCGFENHFEAKFCKNCGTKLSADPYYKGELTKGCKIWFWIVLVVNIILVLSNLSLISYFPGLALFSVLSGGILAGGSAIILFKQKKVGLYMIISMAVLACIVNIANDVNMAFSIICAVFTPAISYYFVNENAAVIK